MEAGLGLRWPGLVLLTLCSLSLTGGDVTETLKEWGASAAQGVSSAAQGAVAGVEKAASNVRHVRDRSLAEVSTDAKLTVGTNTPPGWWGNLFSSTTFKPPPPPAQCQYSHGVNYTIYCQNGNLYDPGAAHTYSTAPYSLPDAAYLAGRKVDKHGSCSAVNFGGSGTSTLFARLLAMPLYSAGSATLLAAHRQEQC